MVLDKLVDVIVSCELGRGCTPVLRVGTLSIDIRWDLAAREEPDADALASPLGRINTTVDLVESIAIGLVAVDVNGTASVSRLARGFDVAITRAKLATEPGLVD